MTKLTIEDIETLLKAMYAWEAEPLKNATLAIAMNGPEIGASLTQEEQVSYMQKVSAEIQEAGRGREQISFALKSKLIDMRREMLG